MSGLALGSASATASARGSAAAAHATVNVQARESLGTERETALQVGGGGDRASGKGRRSSLGKGKGRSGSASVEQPSSASHLSDEKKRKFLEVGNRSSQATQHVLKACMKTVQADRESEADVSYLDMVVAHKEGFESLDKGAEEFFAESQRDVGSIAFENSMVLTTILAQQAMQTVQFMFVRYFYFRLMFVFVSSRFS